MIQTISIPNYSSNNLREQSRLNADVVAPAVNIILQNTQGFSAGDFVIVGTPGGETTEIVTVSNVASSVQIVLTGTGTKLNHTQYDFIYSIVGDTLNVYRAANVDGLQPPDSAFTLLGNIAIQPDQSYTQYSDPAGSDAYWYKYTYYNSVTHVESNLSDSKSARGGGSGAYCSLDAIRSEAGFIYAKYITDEMIDEKRKAAQDEINGALHEVYLVPFAVPVNSFISDVCVRLAAGLLLSKQLPGQIGTNSTADGQAKIDSAHYDLDRIVLKELVLTDATGASMAQPGATGGVSSWPDATTNVTDANGFADRSLMGEGQDGGHVFQMRDLYGYFGRRY